MALPILSDTGTLPAEATRLAEILADFDDTLSLAWIEPQKRTAFDNKPFAVVQNHPDMPEYIVMTLSQNELDHRVIAALVRARNNSIDEIEANELAKRTIAMKAELERREEDAEFTSWAIKSTKTVRHNGVVYR